MSTDPLHAFAMRIKAEALRNDGRITDDLLITTEREVRQQFGGDRVYVGARLPGRRALYLTDLRAGMTISQIAAKHGVSERTIERVAAKHGAVLSSLDDEN